MNPKSFFGELKRRNVYKVAVAYAVVAWLLMQVASQIFPFFDIPNWVVRMVVLLLIIGFPIALIIAWAFEITPEGIKRTEDVDVRAKRSEGVAWIYVAILGVAASVALFFVGRHTARSTSEATINVPEKSIAVLPFENLSEEKANAYFVEGIQDEILTRLSKIADLKVISRTSTQKYKSAPENLREVGKQLGVANLLEGSVQKIGNAVHITVQLIRAATDEHLWAESYNRNLDDVFGVEGEVASAIAEQLNAKLTGAEQKAVTEKPTTNAAAYDAYLRGLAIWHSRYSFTAYQEAVANYIEAVRLDPKFALAWAHLGVLQSFLYFNGVDPNTNTPAAVKEAADRAISLQPDLGEAWVAQGAYRYRVLRDFAGALQAYEEGRKRLPNSALVLQYLAVVERRLGRWQDADAHYQKAIELDPRDLQLRVTYASEFLNLLRDFPRAYSAIDRALEISPNDGDALAFKAALFQAEGRLDEAAKVIARIPADSVSDFVVAVRWTQATFERRFDAAIGVLEQRLAGLKSIESNNLAKTFLVQLGHAQEWAGRVEDARATFARAVQAIKPTPDSVIAPEAQGLPYFLALAYAGLGDKENALTQAQRAVADYANDAVTEPSAEVVLAQVQARFGDFDSAIAALPHLLEVPAGITTADLRLNPLWDALRKDPRFQKLCEEKAK